LSGSPHSLFRRRSNSTYFTSAPGRSISGHSESQRYFSSTCAAVFLFQFSYSELRHSNHRIGAHTCTNQTVPYGTALLGGAVPGTSCQATIAPSLPDAFSPVPLGHNPKSLSASMGLLIHGPLGLAPKGLQDSAQGFNPGNLKINGSP
jgi:hypothetical protein